MKRVLFIWCIASCLLCAILCAQAWLQRSRTIDQQQAAFATTQSNTQRLITDLRRQITAVEDEQKAGMAKLPGNKPKKPTELSDKERFDRMMVKSDTEQKHPGIEAHSRSWMRRHFQDEYGDLFRELNLPPDVLERFKQLLVEEQQAHSDASAIVAAQGISSFSVQGRSAKELAQQLVERDIAELLDAEKFAAYKEYDRVYRDTVRLEDFQSWLAEKNITALEKAQVRALATACCDVSDKARNADYAAISDDYWGTTATQQILQRAQDKLSAEQAKAFAEYRATRDAAEKASDAFIRGEATLPTQQKSP